MREEDAYNIPGLPGVFFVFDYIIDDDTIVGYKLYNALSTEETGFNKDLAVGDKYKGDTHEYVERLNDNEGLGIPINEIYGIYEVERQEIDKEKHKLKIWQSIDLTEQGYEGVYVVYDFSVETIQGTEGEEVPRIVYKLFRKEKSEVIIKTPEEMSEDNQIDSNFVIEDKPPYKIVNIIQMFDRTKIVVICPSADIVTISEDKLP